MQTGIDQDQRSYRESKHYVKSSKAEGMFMMRYPQTLKYIAVSFGLQLSHSGILFGTPNITWTKIPCDWALGTERK